MLKTILQDIALPLESSSRYFIGRSSRGYGPMHENGEWDLKYVEQISLSTDIAIICKTPLLVFGRNKGA